MWLNGRGDRQSPPMRFKSIETGGQIFSGKSMTRQTGSGGSGGTYSRPPANWPPPAIQQVAEGTLEQASRPGDRSNRPGFFPLAAVVTEMQETRRILRTDTALGLFEAAGREGQHTVAGRFWTAGRP